MSYFEKWVCKKKKKNVFIIKLQLSQTLKYIFVILSLYSVYLGFGPFGNKPIVGF